MTHPSSRLDHVVHQRVRLGILTILATASSAEFGYLRDALDVSDGSLSRHLQILEQAGYLKIKKGYVGKRPRTWVSITALGSKALHAEVQELAALLAQIKALPHSAPAK